MTSPEPSTFALFRVAAGPRLGHGHLRRAEVLARALRRPAMVSIRGAGRAWSSLAVTAVASPGRTLDRVRPRVLVLDDPDARHGRAWVAAADRRQLPVVSLHDLGLGRVPSTLAIDGSVASPARGWPADRTLRGLEFAVIGRPRRARARRTVRRVLVSLGGGPRAALTAAIVAALGRRRPVLEIVVTQPGVPARRGPGGPMVTRVDTPAGLASWFARVDVAIVAGGVSLYEAVAVPVVAAQRPTIRGFAGRHLTVDAGGRALTVGAVARRVAERFERLAVDEAARRAVRAAGPRLVDGLGARRVARAIVAVVEAAPHE